MASRVRYAFFGCGLSIGFGKQRENLDLVFFFLIQEAKSPRLGWVRPYLVESTVSRPICEVKQPQA